MLHPLLCTSNKLLLYIYWWNQHISFSLNSALVCSQTAKKMEVNLGQYRPRVFNEINDIVNCDMVFVMDRFDFDEVSTFLVY